MQIIIFIAMGSLNKNLLIFYQIRFIHKTLRNILLIQLPLVFLGLMIGDEILVINGKVVSEHNKDLNYLSFQSFDYERT
jgi:hypothetical protein